MEPLTGTLRKHGVRIRLQEQPFRVLLALIEKPGEVVTREDLHRQIWTDSVFGDFEHNLNIAINKIRAALGDSAETPRFVETLPRRGYRFIAPVEGDPAPPAPLPAVAVKSPLLKWIAMAGVALAVTALIAALSFWLMPAAPPELKLRRLTNDNSTKVGPVLSDGAKLYFTTGQGFAAGQRNGLSGEVRLVQIPVSGGEASSLVFAPPEGGLFSLLDISPSGQELLLVVVPEYVRSEAMSLWASRIADGSSRRVASLFVREARYSPDGNRLVFTAGGSVAPGSLSVASSDGSNARRLLELKGLAIVNPCWSPDGKRIAFGQLNQATQEASAWEVMADGTLLRRLFTDWRESHLPAGWTPDGRLLLISQSRFWAMQQPRFFLGGPSRRIQLSSGEPRFSDLVQLRDGQTAYAVGTTPLGQLQRFDSRSRSWVPHLGGVSAEMVEYSRDGQSLVYTTYPEGELWVRRTDGTRPVRLTAAPMQAGLGRWSPDGRVIAFQGKISPDEPVRIYLADAAGGSVRTACPNDCGSQGDFAWAPDGKKIVFSAAINNISPEVSYLRLLDLGTGQVTRFPGSQGLHSPRVSPDGSAVAALDGRGTGDPANRHPLMLYRFSEAQWKELPNPGPGDPAWQSWSHDSNSIWYLNNTSGSIMRCQVLQNHHEEMVPLKLGEMTGAIGYWLNLTPNDEPMILGRRDIQQIYALSWKAH